MPRELEPDVRALFTACHPESPALATYFFFAYPTLIALDGDGRLLGYTCYSMGFTPDGTSYMTLVDIGVDDSARGRGIGKALMQKRLEIGRAVGAKFAVGMTQYDNHPMLNIWRAFGFKETDSANGPVCTMSLEVVDAQTSPV